MSFFSKFKRRTQRPKDSSSSTFSAESSSEHTPSLISSPATSFLPVPPHLDTPTCKVYVKYDVATPPPRPIGNNWTRFVCISDTYGEIFDVPSGDVLLHAGDLTSSGRLMEFKKTADWLCSLDHPLKILIAGNHDSSLHRAFYDKHYDRFVNSEAEKEDHDILMSILNGPRARQAGIVYLESSSHSFKVRDTGRIWRVFGFPWVLDDWGTNHAFGYLPGPIAETYVSTIPPTDILLTHGPPNGIMDETTRNGLSGLHVGCLTLLEHMKRIRPFLHIFGQVYEGHGAEVRMHDPEGIIETLEINATSIPTGGLQNFDHSSTEMPPGPLPPIIIDIYDVEE
ncbi:hypothetical protein Clacol_004651 [Clathrus columnatus]|uniref:Calcineurin-like phosphoesterase domain-containing protein n=1 Tax=Clathrus columnatus TaxID=1419009 RepID=A0AAV5A834_9AGAM|nr:hypothetical protein Clacol_004651 [Clathrus columnatus]